MQDINEQLQQVEWNEPTPPKEPKSLKPHVVRGVLAAVGVLLLLIIIIAVIQFIRNTAKNKEYTESVEQAREVAERSCAGVQDEEKCLAQIPLRLAEETGDPSYCQDLDKNLADECYGLAALRSQNTRICNEIADLPLRQLCVDALIAGSIQTGDVDACYNLENEELASNCARSQLFNLAQTGDCSHKRMTDDICEAGRIIAEATESGDGALCAELSGDWQVLCYEYTGSMDADQDGLLAEEELEYGTSDNAIDTDGDGLSDYDEVRIHGTGPTFTDTDGDGYDDGVEVNNGFDPLQ